MGLFVIGGLVALAATLAAYGLSHLVDRRNLLIYQAQEREQRLLQQSMANLDPEAVANRLCTQLALGAAETNHLEPGIQIRVVTHYTYTQNVVDYVDDHVVSQWLDEPGYFDGFRFTITGRLPRLDSPFYISLQALRVALTDELARRRSHNQKEA